MAERLKCKFCDWSTMKAYSKNGKFKGVDVAQRRLLEHVELKHYAEWEKVQEQLGAEEC